MTSIRLCRLRRRRRTRLISGGVEVDEPGKAGSKIGTRPKGNGADSSTYTGFLRGPAKFRYYFCASFRVPSRL
jgi:hypothetical protein